LVGRGLTIVGSILEGDFNERADDVALAKEVRELEILDKLVWCEFPAREGCVGILGMSHM